MPRKRRRAPGAALRCRRRAARPRRSGSGGSGARPAGLGTRPSMWRVMLWSGAPRRKPRLGIVGHRPDHRLGAGSASAAPKKQPVDGRRSSAGLVIGGAAEHDAATGRRISAPAASLIVLHAAVDHHRKRRHARLQPVARGHSRAAGCRGFPWGSGPSARPCGHAPRGASTPARDHGVGEGGRAPPRILIVDADAALHRHRHGGPPRFIAAHAVGDAAPARASGRRRNGRTARDRTGSRQLRLISA